MLKVVLLAVMIFWLAACSSAPSASFFCQGEPPLGTWGQVHMSALHNAASVQESHSQLWARTVPERKFRCRKSNSCINWGKLEPLWPGCWRYFCCSGGGPFFRANLALLHRMQAEPTHLEASKENIEMKPKCTNEVVLVFSEVCPIFVSPGPISWRNLHPCMG